MRSILTSTIVLATALALTACGGGDSSDSDAEGNELKKTSLALGEEATLTGASNTHEISVSYEAEEGTPDDLKDFNLEQDEKKMTPWYVRATVTNEGDDEISQEQDPWGFSPDVLDDGGLEAKELALLGDFPTCKLVNAPDPFPAGESFETCTVYLVKEGATLDRLVIEETKFEGANNEFTWKVGS